MVGFIIEILKKIKKKVVIAKKVSKNVELKAIKKPRVSAGLLLIKVGWASYILLIFPPVIYFPEVIL